MKEASEGPFARGEEKNTPKVAEKWVLISRSIFWKNAYKLLYKKLLKRSWMKYEPKRLEFILMFAVFRYHKQLDYAQLWDLINNWHSVDWKRTKQNNFDIVLHFEAIFYLLN